MNRRKLATSRRSQGKQRVNEKTQPDVESRQGVQDEARGNEHPETHASATKQPKVQEEVAQESERDMTAPQAAFLVSAATAEHSEDKTGMLCPEEVKHILDSKDVSMQPFKDETKLEVIESSNTLQSEEVNENLHDRLPELTSVSDSASDQQMISKQAEDFDLCSVAELNSSKLHDSGLFRQDGRSQSNFSVCESRVNSSITPQITADNAFRENIQINDGVEQETFLFQTEELPTSKDDKHCTPKFGDAKLSQEVEDKQYDQNKLTQEQVEHEKDNSTEDLLYDHKDCSSYFENQKSESDSYQSLFLVKSPAVEQDVLTATKETSLDQMDQSDRLVEDKIQTLPSVFKAATETRLHDSSLATDDHTKAGFGSAKRKFGSSRKNKGRLVKDSEEDILENTLNNESLETPTVSSEIQERGNEVVSDVTTTADTISSLSNRGSVCLVPPHDLSSEYPEPDTYSLILTSESLQKGQDKISSLNNLAEMSENCHVSQHEVDQSDILHSEEPIDSLSEDEILQIQQSSEIIPDYVAEHFESISENLNDRPEMSESAGKSADKVTTKQQEHQTEKNILEYTHRVEQKNESYDLYDANSPQISNLEKSNSTPTQVYEFKKGVEDDIKLTADQMYHQEKGLYEIGEENPVLFDSQPQETSGIVDEQSTKGFHSSANRGKLRSGRKSGGKQDKDSKEEVKEKTSDEETTQILDTKITSQEELRLDILPVSYDTPILSVFAPGHSLEDLESLIPGSVNIPESQENSETDINMDLSDKSWGETLGRHSDTHKSKSGSLQTKKVPDSDVDMRKGQEHVALQESEPQQIDYTVAGQVEKAGVFVEDTKHDPSDPELQDNSLSTSEQSDRGFSGSRRKLGSSHREKGRQQGEIPKQEVLESTRDDAIHERPTMLMQEEITADGEPRTTTSVSNNSSFPNSPLDQSFKELSCVPTKYFETDMEDISVNSENFLKNQNESKLDAENTMDVSRRAMDEFEENLDAGHKEIMDGEHSGNTVKQDQENEDPLKDVEGNLELDYISEIVAHDIPKYPETGLGGLIDQAKVTRNTHSELTVKSTEDSATEHKLMLIGDQQITCFIAEGNVEALDQTSKDGHLYDSKETSISSPLGITANLGQMDTGGSIIEGSEPNPTDSNLQDTSLTTDEQIDADFSFKGNKRKLGSSRRKKGRQDVKESKQEVSENNGGEKAIDTSPVLLKVKMSEQEELSKASEEEMFWSHSTSMSHVLSSEDQTSEVTEGPDKPLKGLTIKCENHQEDVDKIFNVLVQDGKQSEDLSSSQYKAHTEDTRDAGLEDVTLGHPEEVHSITMQESLQMGYYSETSNNIHKTFDIMSENLTEQNERSQLTVKGNDDITEKQEERPTEEMISETLDLKSGETEQDDTKPKTDQIFHQEKGAMFCKMEENKPVLSNFQIETVSLDPMLQESSESTEEQINTDFSRSASKRKLGSSRKGKARRQVNEFKDEVNEKTTVDEVDETHRTTQISLDTETISQEEKSQDMEQDATLLVSNDNSFAVFACGDSSEVQDPIQTNHPEVELDSLIQGIVNCPENQNQSEFLQSKDRTLQNKVIGGELSDNAAKHAQENELTNTEGNLEMDYTPETVAHDVPKYPETALKGVIDQGEISSKIHAELTLKHAADSGTEQELVPDEVQQNLCYTTERNLEALNQTSQDDHLYDSNETSISGPIGVNTTLGYTDEGGTLEEGSELNSNVQHSSVSTNERANDGFSFNENRRKLGSSRRNKGRPGFKESKQEVFENHRSDETPQTSTISVETRGSELEELSEDIEHKIILSLSKDLSSVSPHILSSENQIAVLKNDPDTNLQNLILKNEHFGDKGERKLETEVEMIEKSMNVPHQEEGQSDAVHSEDTRDAEPEDALREVEKIKFHPTQMQDSIHIECYSETVVGNVSENEEVIPENLSDQTGMSELTVKATNDSATKEEANSVKKSYPENLDVKNEDSGVFDNNKPHVIDLEKTNSVPYEMNEFEGRVSDDTKPNPGFVVNPGMEGLCEMKENSSAQTDMASFDSPSHKFSQNVDEQLNKGIYNASNRRKLGSSRRIKERHQVKESKEEDKENTWGDETLSISETKMACEELEQDLLSPDSSGVAPGNSSDVQSSLLNNYSETDLQSLIQESHSEDQDESETGNVKLSHKSEEDTLLDKSDVQESNDQTLQSKVTGPGCSDDVEKQAEEHENLPADIEVCLQKDYTSETVAHDMFTYPEGELGNMIDQAEIINHGQSDLTTKSFAYSNTKEKLLPAEGQQNLCFTTQGNLEALDQTSKDEHIFDSKETSISNPVGVNSTLSQMGEGGILVKSTTQNPKETKYQDNSLTTDEQTDAGLHGSRRKLGSSRRKKGRQQGKESQEEVLENTSCDKTFEMPTMSSETTTVEQEEQREETKREMILSVSHDSSMSLIPPVISSNQSTSVPTNYPDEDVQSLTLANENLHEDVDDRKSDVSTSDEAKQNVFHGDPRNAVSENVVHEDVHSIQVQDSVQTDSEKGFADDATENVDIISRALTDKTEESEINVNCINDIPSTQEACPSKEIISAAPGLKNEETIQQDVQPNTNHIVNQNNEGLVLQMEENKFAMSDLQSENVPSGSHLLESSEHGEEQTKKDFHSRRKLGSSRRNKGRGNAKDIGQPIAEADFNASMNELGEKTTETVTQDQETLMGIVLDKTENDSSQTNDANISTSFCMTAGMQLSAIVDQEDSDTSCCMQITDRELLKHYSRDHDEYRELQDGNLQESTSLPEPHAGPPPAELHAEINSSCEHTEPESGDGDAFKKAFEQETEPEQNQKMLEAAEKKRDSITECPEALSRNLFSENEKNAMKEKTEILQPDKNVQSEQLSESPEKTTEKGSSMQNAQVVSCVEQVAVSSPQEMFNTDGEEHQHIILSRAAETHDLLDIHSKEQKEQIKTGQMQDMRQISFPNDKSLRETMQSDKDVTLDSHPEDNYQDLTDNAHPGFKASGNRRKLGSSRRTKGRKHGQVNEQNQENKDEALENTGDDERTTILAGRQEELENFILPNILPTFSSPVTEKLLEENTVSSHDVLKDSTIAKSDFNSNTSQENSIKSNVETKEKDAKCINEAEDSTQLTGHDTNKTGLMQSGQDSVLSSDSDMQSILFISPKSKSVCVIDQEEALQRQKIDALSSEKDPLGAEVHLKETNKEIETAGFISTEVCSSQVESSMDLQNPKKDDVEGKYMNARKQENSSNEFVSASQEPAMDASYEGGISTTVNPMESQGEKPQETSKQKKRKIGSSRRTPLNRKRDGERHERDEAEESDYGAKAEMTNLGEMEVVGKVLVNEDVLQGKDVQPQQEASLQQETLETETGDGLQSSNMSLAFPPEQSATIDVILETPKPDDFTNIQTQICSEDTERNSRSLNQPASPNSGTPGGSLKGTQGDERSPESIKVSQDQDVQEQMPSSMTESIHTQNPVVRNESPDLTPTNRRRKMGSTRKNLGTRTKEEILEPENESTDTVLSSGAVTVASVSEKKETALHLVTEHTDVNTDQEKQKEAVEISQFGESLLRALAEEEKAEESSISQTHTAETSGLSSSPSNDGTSGRRKKFGSNRKSGLQQRKPDQNAQNEDEAGGLIEGRAEREESSGLRKISEVDENGQKPSSSADILEATGSSKTMRDKTPEKPVHRNIRLDQESGSQLSFGAASGASKSEGYNVVMIGESCVGKTSFMKRAQSGKFFLDIPASVGLDSCKWTVVVDGKPVVLQLWDTAGQERFHSITRQVFHKAQAFLLMYDITSSQSFSAVSYWANSIQEAAAEDVTVLLLGNKSEHAKRQVKTEQGDVLAKEYNFEFMECSAATGENVIEALEAVARMLSHRADLLGEEVTVLHKEPTQRKSSKCC